MRDDLSAARRAAEASVSAHDAQMGALQASHDARVASIEARVEAALRSTAMALGGAAAVTTARTDNLRNGRASHAFPSRRNLTVCL